MTTVIIVIILIIFILISLFLYKNFYQTITQSREILLLREKVAIETVDLEKFNQIINKLKEKTAAKEPRPLVSPFR